jgi:hypothetical protein
MQPGFDNCLLVRHGRSKPIPATATDLANQCWWLRVAISDSAQEAPRAAGKLGVQAIVAWRLHPRH